MSAKGSGQRTFHGLSSADHLARGSSRYGICRQEVEPILSFRGIQRHLVARLVNRVKDPGTCRPLTA